MIEARRPGRPKASEGGVGRDAIIDGTIAVLRLGKPELTRKEIAAFLGITPALITYYFAKGHTLLIAAVSKQADLWLRRMDEVVSAGHGAKDLLDQLQGLIISMYARDRHIVDLHEQLWRDGRMSFSLLSALKERLHEVLPAMVDGIDHMCPRMLGYGLWGACEAYARDEHPTLVAQIVESSSLLEGKLVPAPRSGTENTAAALYCLNLSPQLSSDISHRA